MISSTRSSESAFRSSTKEASGVTCSSSTPSCSTTIFFIRSYVEAATLLPPLASASLGRRSTFLSTVRAVGAGLPRDPAKDAVHEPAGRLSTVDTREAYPLSDHDPGGRGRV